MNFQIYKISVLFILFLLFSCGSKALSPLPTSATILAFGDSLTVGYGTTQDYSYPAVLSELSGRTVINAGISGETTEQGLARFQHELEKHSPDLVILIEGGNDILRNVSQSISKQNLAKMINTAQELNIPLVLLGVPEKNLFSDAAPYYAELAKEHQLVFNKSLLSKLLKKPKLKSDAIHLNSDGYRKMAEGIYDLLKDNGAL